MRRIFISYRRHDAEGESGRLFDDLVREFGARSVFMDVATIGVGRDFRKAIDDSIATCGVLLAMIGPGWLDAQSERGGRRLDDPDDFVRIETASALRRGIPVIPVLVRRAKVPPADHLPADLADLAFRNAVELTHARWKSDMQILIGGLRPLVNDADDESSPSESTRVPSSPRAGTRRELLPWRFVGLVIIVAILGAAGLAWRRMRAPEATSVSQSPSSTIPTNPDAGTRQPTSENKQRPSGLSTTTTSVVSTVANPSTSAVAAPAALTRTNELGGFSSPVEAIVFVPETRELVVASGRSLSLRTGDAMTESGKPVALGPTTAKITSLAAPNANVLLVATYDEPSNTSDVLALNVENHTLGVPRPVFSSGSSVRSLTGVPEQFAFVNSANRVLFVRNGTSLQVGSIPTALATSTAFDPATGTLAVATCRPDRKTRAQQDPEARIVRLFDSRDLTKPIIHLDSFDGSCHELVAILPGGQRFVIVATQSNPAVESVLILQSRAKVLRNIPLGSSDSDDPVMIATTDKLALVGIGTSTRVVDFASGSVTAPEDVGGPVRALAISHDRVMAIAVDTRVFFRWP